MKYKIIIPSEKLTISDEAKQRAKNYMSLKGALEPKDVVLGYKTSLDAQMLDSHYVNFSNPNADKITSNTTNKPIENRKTAMQELFDNLESIDITVPIGIKKIFFEKEKEQIINTFKEAQVLHAMNNQMRGEQYYIEIYGK